MVATGLGKMGKGEIFFLKSKLKGHWLQQSTWWLSHHIKWRAPHIDDSRKQAYVSLDSQTANWKAKEASKPVLGLIKTKKKKKPSFIDFFHKAQFFKKWHQPALIISRPAIAVPPSVEYFHGLGGWNHRPHSHPAPGEDGRKDEVLVALRVSEDCRRKTLGRTPALKTWDQTCMIKVQENSTQCISRFCLYARASPETLEKSGHPVSRFGLNTSPQPTACQQPDSLLGRSMQSPKPQPRPADALWRGCPTLIGSGGVLWQLDTA